MTSMPRRFIFQCLLLLIFLLSSPSLYAKYDPDLAWYTQETEHFLFHYHDGTEDAVNDFIQHAEDIHQRLTGFFDWQPKAKTHVILNDHFDSPNGNARTFPYNVIEMYLTLPSDVESLEDYKDWQYLLFEHEYTHILQLDMADDFPLHMRNVIGRHWLLFPNQYLPKWLIEGIATYIETKTEAGTGRGQSSYYRGLMQTEVNNGIRDLSRVNEPQLAWPGGTTRYLYGVYFFTFLEKKYGEPLIQEFMHAYSRFPVPYFVNTTFARVFGKNLYHLWDEFSLYLQDEFALEKKNQPANIQVLSTSGFQSGFSQSFPNGDILFIRDNREDIKSLVRYSPHNKTYKTVFQSIAIGKSFDIHPAKGILIPLVDWKNNTRLMTDLYVLNSKTKQKTRITKNQRYIRAIWHPNGEQIIAIKTQANAHQLDLLNSQGKKLKTLWDSEKNLVIGPMDFSPSGEKMIASVFRSGKGWGLEEFNIASQQWMAITDNPAIESHPQYVNQGNSIVYSAEYSGVYNIYDLSLADKKITQLTDMNTAALRPTLEGDRLYYAALTKNGFNLHSQPLNLSQNKPHDLPSQPEDSLAITKTHTHNGAPKKRKPYNALKYLKPLWWEPLPIVQVDNEQTTLGFVFGSNDPIKRHRYHFVLAYDVKNNMPLWNANYTYDRLTPTISFNTKKNLFYLSNFVTRQESMSISWPFKKINNKRFIFTTAKRLNIRFLDRSDLEERNSDLIALGMVRDSTSHPVLAVSPHSGSHVQLSYETNRFFEPIKPSSRIILDAAFYSPVFYKAVFELATTVVSAGGQAGSLFLGGGRNTLFNSGISGKRIYSLSGYKPGSVVGTNLQKLRMNLHIPLIYPQRSLMTPPIGISRIKFRPFFHMARAGSFDNIDQQNWRKGLGSELEFQANFGYGIFPFNFKTGIAQGLDEGGEFTYYFSFVSKFL